MDSLIEENESLKQDVAELKAHVAAREEKEQEEHTEIQERLIGEFDMPQDEFNAKLIKAMVMDEFGMTQEEFNAKLIKALQSPEVVNYLGGMLHNAMGLGLGR